MANTFNATLMPRILAGALRVLREETALAGWVNKDYDGAAGKLGQVVSIAVPYAQSAYNVTPAAVPPALVDSTFKAVNVTIDQWKATRFSLSQTDVVNYDLANSEIVPNQIKEAARSLARGLNQYLFGMYWRFYGFTGTSSASFYGSAITGAADVRKQLNEQLVPEENRVHFVSLGSEALMLKQANLTQYLQAGDTEALRKGFIGQVYGMNFYRDRDVPTHTAGTAASLAVSTGGATIGDTSIAVVGTCAIKKGDCVYVNGTTGSQTYSAQTDLTLATAAGTLTVEPGLIAAATSGDAIVIASGFGTAVNMLACDPLAWALVMRTPPSTIEGAPVLGPEMVMTDDKTGIPLKLSYLPGYHASQFELSCLYGAQVIDPRRGVRVLSTV